MSTYICYSCYTKGHFATDCTMPLRDFRKLLINFEALSLQEKQRVLKDFYDMVTKLMEAGDRKEFFGAPREARKVRFQQPPGIATQTPNKGSDKPPSGS